MSIDQANAQVGMLEKLIGGKENSSAILASLQALTQLQNASKKLQLEKQNINVNGANMRYMLGLLLSEAQRREDRTLAGLAGNLSDMGDGVDRLLFGQSDTFR